jgi:hypothetical protein
MNIAGPFPQRDRGNRYLLIAMDYFNKWPDVYVIFNQEASAVAEALVTKFCQLGISRELQNDKSHNFDSWLMQEVL